MIEAARLNEMVPLGHLTKGKLVLARYSLQSKSSIVMHLSKVLISVVLLVIKKFCQQVLSQESKWRYDEPKEELQEPKEDDS